MPRGVLNSLGVKFDVLIFGPLAAKAGARRLSAEVTTPTASALRARLVASHPDLASLIASARFAVNQEFVTDDATITERDEVALIGAVSGG